ncbi:methyltransferase [Flavobacterium dauae]|uniref:tRNA1(Val) (adenine(37)-N6)-methyltransferase n=1 Tax=Flavobacterium dauae TaxID=1563479 RepID=UPI00101B2906|nr:methyltransferase [Flavobacterium dauae]WLD23074.1 methyltransferase [Flavobacterium dauae]
MFQFKQFTINQDRCAMKVGTDGVLLGAWTPLYNNPYRILDIGSGTGLIALMLVQRSFAEQIDAVEIDEEAFTQCVENFENSPWADRLYCYNASLEDFTEEFFEETTYDLIVSNPPFYSENYSSGDEKRDQARFTESLPFEQLIACTEGLLSENGILSVIIPYKEEANFIKLAAEYGLYPFKICRVQGTPESEIKRSMLAFTRIPAEIDLKKLIIETQRHQYTNEYIDLTKDFYLKM